MIKYCLDKWDKNQDKLREALAKDAELYHCGYTYIVKLVVQHILNDGVTNEHDMKWSMDITEIDDGNYQGTLLYLIPANTYQPSASEYLMTHVYYGSCSVCDTLQRIQADFNWMRKVVLPNEEQINDFMTLCRNLICNMIKPYNTGWGYESDFDTIEF